MAVPLRRLADELVTTRHERDFRVHLDPEFQCAAVDDRSILGSWQDARAGDTRATRRQQQRRGENTGDLALDGVFSTPEYRCEDRHRNAVSGRVS